MVSSLSKDALTLTEAAALPNTPDRSSMWRWCRIGVKAANGKTIRLQHSRLGGRIFTTIEAIETFASELAAADCEHFDARRTQPAETQ